MSNYILSDVVITSKKGFNILDLLNRDLYDSLSIESERACSAVDDMLMIDSYVHNITGLA